MQLFLFPVSVKYLYFPNIFFLMKSQYILTYFSMDMYMHCLQQKTRWWQRAQGGIQLAETSSFMITS